MLDSTGHLAIALLSIYSVYTPLILYLLRKHGKHGLLGWIYLLAFGTLRITGSILVITNENAHKNSSSASVINSIALSPLILTSFGILHEAYVSPSVLIELRRPPTTNKMANPQFNDYRNHTIRGTPPRFLGLPLVILVHLLSYGGIGLAATGGQSLTTSNKSSTAAGELKGGILIFATVWLLLVALSFLSTRYKRTVRESQWVCPSHLTQFPPPKPHTSSRPKRKHVTNVFCLM
jgi:hypothetical protein